MRCIKEGDKNTGFFHPNVGTEGELIKSSPCAGTIIHTVMISRSWKDLLQVFLNLFFAQDTLVTSEVTQFVPSKVTDQMNEELSKHFSVSELERALFMMKPNSSPGPNGFTAGFFQNHWGLLKDNVCGAVLDFLNGGPMPDDYPSAYPQN